MTNPMNSRRHVRLNRVGTAKLARRNESTVVTITVRDAVDVTVARFEGKTVSLRDIDCLLRWKLESSRQGWPLRIGGGEVEGGRIALERLESLLALVGLDRDLRQSAEEADPFARRGRDTGSCDAQ